MYELSLIEKIVVAAVPIIFAITVHEVAHGWVASKLGDPTAKLAGSVDAEPGKTHRPGRYYCRPSHHDCLDAFCLRLGKTGTCGLAQPEAAEA